MDMIELREVGPRDGLQSLPRLPTALKVNLVDSLSAAGLRYIEVCSFVNPTYIPQMTDAEKVFRAARKAPNVDYAVLVPNKKYYYLAREYGVKTIAVFISSNEQHNQRNVGRGIEENMEDIEEVVELAKCDGVKVRAYLSCVWGYMHEPNSREVSLIERLAGWFYGIGAYEISIADTTSLSRPATVAGRFKRLSKIVPIERLALHVHCRDVFEEKIDAAMAAGVEKFDCSIGGFGGHMPDYIIGNVATEKLAHYLEEKGVPAGVDVEKLEKIAAGLKATVARMITYTQPGPA